MMYPLGDSETTDFTPLIMVILFIEEEVEEAVEEVEEVEEGESGFKKDIWKDPMEVLVEEMVMITIEGHNNHPLQRDPNHLDKRMNGLYLLIMKEEMTWRDAKQHRHLPQLPLLLQKKDYLLIGAVKVLQEKEQINEFSQLGV